MKSFILLIVLCFSSFSSHAQISFRGGLNISGIRDNSLIDNTSYTGIHLGGEYYFMINKKSQNFLVHLGILNSLKGYTQSLNGREYIFSFIYTSFPVGLTYKPVPFLGIEGGMEFSKLLSARFDDQANKVNVKANYNSWDYGLFFGFIVFEDRLFSGYVRYVHGLSNLIDYPDIDNFGNVNRIIKDLKNQTFQIGIRFNLRFHENFN